MPEMKGRYVLLMIVCCSIRRLSLRDWSDRLRNWTRFLPLVFLRGSSQATSVISWKKRYCTRKRQRPNRLQRPMLSKSYRPGFSLRRFGLIWLRISRSESVFDRALDRGSWGGAAIIYIARLRASQGNQGYSYSTMREVFASVSQAIVALQVSRWTRQLGSRSVLQ